MLAKQETISQKQSNSNIKEITVLNLKSYVEKYYPSLSNLITEPQYEQLAWNDYERCTNQALLVPEQITMADFPFQTKRIIARLYFLMLFRSADTNSAHVKLIEGQTSNPLDITNFELLVTIIKNLTETEYQQLWVSCLTSVSNVAKHHAVQHIIGSVPADSYEFLAKIMSEQAKIYPAARELMQQDQTACAGFKIIFSSGHLRHMLDVEGDNKMFNKLLENKLNLSQLNLWFSYWLMDITSLSVHTKDGLGSEYLTNNVAKTVLMLKRHLNELLENPGKPILRDYLEERALMLNLQFDAGFFTSNDVASHLILTRVASMLRLFSADFSASICAGLKELKETLEPTEYNKILAIFNPVQQAPWPTPTYTPVLLTNLLKTTKSYQRAIVLGLPLIVRALEAYDKLFQSQVITMPINFNSLASSNNINRITSGEKFDISVNCDTGDISPTEIIPTQSKSPNSCSS